MTYARIETSADLPREGPLNDRAREKSDLDFKTFADSKQMWEHAKDIAAFANAMGGVILIGADDRSGQLVYPGIAGQGVKELETIYYDAAQLCSPPPLVNVLLIPDRNVVAVNVEPFPDQIVAAPARIRNDVGTPGIQSDAWVFPIRRGALTDWIKPENLAMYMNRDVRRAVLLLARIPEKRRSDVTIHFHRMQNSAFGTREVGEKSLAIGRVSVESNYVELEQHHGSTVVRCRVPLTDVMDAWESETLAWRIKIRGEILNVNVPSGTALRYGVLPP